MQAMRPRFRARNTARPLARFESSSWHSASASLGQRGVDQVPDRLGLLVGVHLLDHTRRRVVVQDGHLSGSKRGLLRFGAARGELLGPPQASTPLGRRSYGSTSGLAPRKHQAGGVPAAARARVPPFFSEPPRAPSARGSSLAACRAPPPCRRPAASAARPSRRRASSRPSAPCRRATWAARTWRGTSGPTPCAPSGRRCAP